MYTVHQYILHILSKWKYPRDINRDSIAKDTVNKLNSTYITLMLKILLYDVLGTVHHKNRDTNYL